MTMLNIFSAGLIATAMLTTAASAHENRMSEWRAIEHARDGSIAPLAHGTEGRRWMLAPPVAGYADTPTEQPGGTCDHGDDPQIC